MKDLEALKITLAEDSQQLDWTDTNSFLLSYGHLTGFFEKKGTLTESDFIIGAHFAYGWMPTILDFRANELAKCVEVLNLVKNKQNMEDDDLMLLTQAVNGSLVGTSKLLHFISPDTYPIWDRNVRQYLRKTPGGPWGIKSITAYRKYVQLLKKLSVDSDLMTRVRRNMHASLDSSVSELRVLEMVMFLKGRELRRGKKRAREQKRQ